MFGLIVSGRLISFTSVLKKCRYFWRSLKQPLIIIVSQVQTDFSQVGETQFVITLPQADAIKHIVIFLTGTQPFPDGLGGSVYFSWPEENTAPSWHLLGTISNEKPSAIFKISGLKVGPQSSFTQGLFSQQQAVAHHAQVGISVEPLAQIAGLTPAPSTEASTVNSFVEFSRAMCDNLFNFASSFAQSPDKIVPVFNEQYLPMSVLTKWYENFIRKLEQNPYFWKK